MSLKTTIRTTLAFALATASLLVGSAAWSAPVNCPQVFSPRALAVPGARVAITNQRLENNEFTVSRSLDNYDSHFPLTRTEKLQMALRGLERGSVWVDMGAGEGRALDDGLRMNGGLYGVGISYKKPAKALDSSDLGSRHRYLDGDFVENMARDGKLDELVGRVDVITDVYGPMSYSEHLPQLLQAYLDLLQPGGRFYGTFMAERNYEPQVTPPGPTLFPMNVVSRHGRVVPDGLIEWLRTIPGVELLEVVGAETNYSVVERSRAFVLRKTQVTVVVPTDLKTVLYRESSPPVRHFEIEVRN